jgi:hypothetical protein
MWFLSFLPTSFLSFLVHSMLFFGLVGYLANIFLKNIPIIKQYSVPLKIISIVLVVLGIFFEGSLMTEKSWRAKVEELEQKIAIAEVKSNETNTKIETVYVDRIETVKEIQYVTLKNIRSNSAAMDKDCKIEKNVIDLLNNSARGVK